MYVTYVYIRICMYVCMYDVCTCAIMSDSVCMVCYHVWICMYMCICVYVWIHEWCIECTLKGNSNTWKFSLYEVIFFHVSWGVRCVNRSVSVPLYSQTRIAALSLRSRRVFGSAPTNVSHPLHPPPPHTRVVLCTPGRCWWRKSGSASLPQTDSISGHHLARPQRGSLLVGSVEKKKEG